MTVASTLRSIRALGLAAVYADREYTINYPTMDPRRTPSSAYYTSDGADAYHTALQMAAWTRTSTPVATLDTPHTQPPAAPESTPAGSDRLPDMPWCDRCHGWHHTTAPHSQTEGGDRFTAHATPLHHACSNTIPGLPTPNQLARAAHVCRPFLSPFSPSELDTIAGVLITYARQLQTAQRTAADASGRPRTDAEITETEQLFTLAQRAQNAARRGR